MTSQEIEIAVEELKNCANIVLETDSPARVRYHVYLSLRRLAQVITGLNTRLESLESEARND